MDWRSPDLISTATSAVLETIAEWQNRRLETSDPLVFFDAIRALVPEHRQKWRALIHVASALHGLSSRSPLIRESRFRHISPHSKRKLLLTPLEYAAIEAAGRKGSKR